MTTNQLAAKKLADLQIQAMMFSMDVDFESLTLVPKSTYKEKPWIKRWREKLNNSDYMADGSDDQGWE